MMEQSRWFADNDRFLSASLDWLKMRLENFTPLGKEKEKPPEEAELQAKIDAAQQITPPPALRLLTETFKLSRFEQDVLLLCAAMELDSEIAEMCARVQDNPNRSYPTFALAMAIFKNPTWDALSPERPLRKWFLIEFAQAFSHALTTSPIRADERIVSIIKGINTLDDRVAAILSRVDLPADITAPLPPSQAAQAQFMIDRIQSAQWTNLPVIQLIGGDSTSKQMIVRYVVKALRRQLYSLPAALIPHSASDLDRFLRLWKRECRLLRLALYVDCEDTDPETPRNEATLALERLLEPGAGLLFLSTRDPWPNLSPYSLLIDINKPTATEQETIWSNGLGESARNNPAVLSGQFNLSQPVIESIVNEVLLNPTAKRSESVPNGPDKNLDNQLWDACRAHTRPQIERLAQRLEPKAKWKDLVLPPEQMDLLHQISNQVGQRSKVYDKWKFRERMNRGFGISVLFAGPSGTGKTMAAEVIANDLRLDLYRIDLSNVVNKYIGETEKNLRRLFDAAEDGCAILFFDEADALFGKRSEVRDSHDRYANIEISYLLQRMEAYQGLAILATNMKTALDEAFLRRLRFIVEFPYPGEAERKRIWDLAFPADLPGRRTLDYDRLARFPLTGGSIHNVAINAAFTAAQAGGDLTNDQALVAVKTELRKLDLPINQNLFPRPAVSEEAK
jgi:hypothetical protein